LISDDAVRAAVIAAASYQPEDRYLLFELCPTEVRCNGYGDVVLPQHRRWRADAEPSRPEGGEPARVQ